MIARLLLALTAVVAFAAPAVAQDMPALIYDFTWTVDSHYVPSNGGPRPTAHLTGSGPLVYTANEESRRVTMSFGTTSNGGNFTFDAVGTAPGVHADDNFKFTTGLEAFSPPIPGSCGRFPAQGDCRVAAFTTPSNAFAGPSSFKLEGYYAFDCLPQFGGGCNGAASWGSSLTGTATLHTSTASAAEPTTLVVVAAGLLAAHALGRRRRSV